MGNGCYIFGVVSDQICNLLYITLNHGPYNESIDGGDFRYKGKAIDMFLQHLMLTNLQMISQN